MLFSDTPSDRPDLARLALACVYAHVLMCTAVYANQSPTAGDFSLVVSQDRSRVSAVRAEDPDGDALTIEIVGDGSIGSATVDSFGGTITYTPNAGLTGDDSFGYRVSDGAADSVVATCRVKVVPTGQVAGLTVLIVVRDLLMPEIAPEVARLRTDLESEGYAVEVLAFDGSTAEALWQSLADAYLAAPHMVGALLIGELPYASSRETGEISDMVYWDLFDFRRTSNAGRQIWVGRIAAMGPGGEELLAGGEAELIGRALDANHAYRTGASRYAHVADYFFDIYAVDLASSAARLEDVVPVSDTLQPREAWSACYELMDETTHGQVEEYDNGHVSMWKIHDLLGQTRFAFCSSCSSGAPGGIVNNQLLTRGGGNILSVGASVVAYVGFFEIARPTLAAGEFRSLLGSGETVGLSLLTRFAGNEPQRTIMYGDLSVPVAMHPHNDAPAVDSLTSSATSGTAPLNVTLSATASDPDGTIARYEWFPTGHDYGRAAPVAVGTTASIPDMSASYVLPHRYSARVEVVDAFGARAYREVEIDVAPDPNGAIRVICGTDIHKRAWQTYTPDLDFVDSSGSLWLHDQQYAPGTWGWTQGADYLFASTDRAVTGTEDDAVFQGWRTTDDTHAIAYRVPLPDGSYQLTLYFADMQNDAAGERLVDVAVDGAGWLSAYDVVAAAGGRDTVVAESTSVDVSGGSVEFVVSRNAGAARPAILNAFTIVRDGTANAAPTISLVADREVAAGQTCGPIAFTVDDAQTPVGALHVSAAVGDASLLPPSHVVLGGTGANRTVSFTAASTIAGTTTLTLIVTDGDLTASTTFDVAVVAPVEVISPDGGERYFGGQLIPIRWTWPSSAGDVNVTWHGTMSSTIATATPNDGLHYFEAPNVSVAAARVEVADAADGVPSDISDGTFSVEASPDTDGDGMADAWELENSLDPTTAADADDDPDGDGAVNLHEFLYGSDPDDGTSVPPSGCRPDLNVPQTAVLRDGLDGYAGTTDTFVDEYAPDAAYGNESRLDVNHYNASEHTETLLRFDVSSVPDTSVVSSATLRMWSTRANVNDGTDVVEVREVLSAWSESITWNDGQPPTAPGVAGPTVAGLSISPAAPELWTVLGLDALVQGWITAPATNHGVLLRCASNLNLRLVSSENASWPACHPELTVVYAPYAAAPANAPPVLSQPAPGAALAVLTGDDVTVDAAATDADDDASSLAFAWDADAADGLAFSDGAAASATLPGYASAGTYSAVVRVRDAHGGEDYASVTITVTGPTIGGSDAPSTGGAPLSCVATSTDGTPAVSLAVLLLAAWGLCRRGAASLKH